MTNEQTGVFLIILILYFAVVSFVFTLAIYQNLKTEAIKRGFARYNEKTGKWEWKE